MGRAISALIVCLASLTLTGAAVLIGRVLSPMTDVLAYASDNDIWLTDLTRQQTYNLTSMISRDVDNAPSWSPDGRWLAFRTVRNSPNSRPHGEIALIEIATRQVTLLTDETSWDDSPAWSPDGRWIAFRSDRDTHAGMGVYLIDLERPFDLPRLLERDSHIDLIPSWSPDSARVVMTLTIGDNTQVIAVDIESGTGTQLLPRTAYHPRLSPDGTQLAAFAWSPDGTAIVYGSTENARSVIKRVDVETGATSILFSTPAYVSGVSWRP